MTALCLASSITLTLVDASFLQSSKTCYPLKNFGNTRWTVHGSKSQPAFDGQTQRQQHRGQRTTAKLSPDRSSRLRTTKKNTIFTRKTSYLSEIVRNRVIYSPRFCMRQGCNQPPCVWWSHEYCQKNFVSLHLNYFLAAFGPGWECGNFVCFW